jgi:branched-chain amino acid transport system substrate-binding protein
MKRIRKLTVICLVLSLLLGVVACSGSSDKESTGSAGDKVLKIGVVGPESGGSAQLGQAQRNSIVMAIEEVNEKGVAGDWKLEAFFEDDEGNPTKSSNATVKLIQQNNVHLILGAINSSCTLADMVVTEKEGIPHVCSGSTSAALTQQGHKMFFRTTINDAYQADAQMKYAKEELGLTKVATITAADDYGQSGAILLKESAEKYGLELVSEQTYNNGDKDMKPQLITMRDAGTEGIFMWGLYTEGALIAIQARQLGMTGQIFGASGMASLKLIELSEEAGQGLLITQSFLANMDDANVKKYVESYTEKYKESPIPHGAQAYDSIYIIADAVKRADSSDPQKLADALFATSGLSLVTGDPKFTEFGDDIGKRVLITEISGDEYVLVKAVVTDED